jgi:hypothetical protein
MSLLETRLAVVAHSYIPVPLIGKKPAIRAWSAITAVSPAMLEAWSRDCPAATNTGCLTRFMPTLDVDLLNDPAALAVEALVRERFSDRGRILTRIGRPPKRAIPFRCGAPFKKLTVTFTTAPGQDTEKLELLADGQQVAILGIHPDTQKEYCWTGGDPTTVAATDLPEIAGTEAQELMNDLAVMLVEDFGYVIAPAPGNGRSARGARNRAAPKSTARDAAWARSALERECAAVARAPNGSRNAQLNLSSYNIHQITSGNPGLLDEDEVRQCLFEAARACGLVDDDGEDNAWKTIRSGAEAARSQPRVRPVPAPAAPAPNGAPIGVVWASPRRA